MFGSSSYPDSCSCKYCVQSVTLYVYLTDIHPQNYIFYTVGRIFVFNGRLMLCLWTAGPVYQGAWRILRKLNVVNFVRRILLAKLASLTILI